jgi:hypothetical protein
VAEYEYDVWHVEHTKFVEDRLPDDAFERTIKI